MTQPAGSITYNNYELLLHGVSYGITDRVQASVTVLSPIVRDMPFVGFARGEGPRRLDRALPPGAAGVARLGPRVRHDRRDDANVYTVGAGAFASYCLRQDCSSLLSASATYQLAIDPRRDQQPRTW